MTGQLRLVVASANPHKAAEIVEILTGELGDVIELVERPADLGDIDETGETLLDNARLKAYAVRDATAIASVADDTGLEVFALGGEPGVYSARYAGEHASYEDNVSKLLASLDGVADRSAQFRTVVVVAFPGGEEIVAEGIVHGTIAATASGAGGFGYDPIFLPDGAGGRSFAELASDEKNAISHRGEAFRALSGKLRERFVR